MYGKLFVKSVCALAVLAVVTQSRAGTLSSANPLNDRLSQAVAIINNTRAEVASIDKGVAAASADVDALAMEFERTGDAHAVAQKLSVVEQEVSTLTERLNDAFDQAVRARRILTSLLAITAQTEANYGFDQQLEQAFASLSDLEAQIEGVQGKIGSVQDAIATLWEELGPDSVGGSQ
jgi:peptidoglycan hydrolase CwlO-like protein